METLKPLNIKAGFYFLHQVVKYQGIKLSIYRSSVFQTDMPWDMEFDYSITQCHIVAFVGQFLKLSLTVDALKFFDPLFDFITIALFFVRAVPSVHGPPMKIIHHTVLQTFLNDDVDFL